MIPILFWLLFCGSIFAERSLTVVIPKSFISPPSSPPVPTPPPTIINNQNANALFGASNAIHLDKETIQKNLLYGITILQQWLQEHRQPLVFCSAILMVAYLYHLYWRATHLMHNRSWTCWCSNHDMSDITQDNLLVALHQHHLNATTINNQRLLFATFLETIDEEKDILQKASWIDWLLDKLYIKKLVRCCHQTTVTQSLKNLEELRICFVKWYTHQVLIKGFTDA